MFNRFIRGIDQRLSGLLLKNRSLALYVVTLIDSLLFSMFFLSKIELLKSLKRRVFVARVALLIEKGSHEEADKIIFSSSNLLLRFPSIYNYLLEIILDKKYKLKSVGTFLSGTPFQQINKNSKTLDLNIVLASLNVAAGRYASQDFDFIIKERLSLSQVNKLIEILRKLNGEFSEELLAVLKDNKYLSNQASYLVRVELYRVKNDPKLIVREYDNYGYIFFENIKYVQTLCSAIFLVHNRQKVKKFLLATFEKASEKNFKIQSPGDVNYLLSLGLIFYNYGFLDLYRHLAEGVLRKIDNLTFNQVFVKEGVVKAYAVLNSPLASVLGNSNYFHNFTYPLSKLKNKDVNKKFLFVSSVNALCNQFMYASFFNFLQSDYPRSTVVCDIRLKEIFEYNFINLRFIGLDKNIARESSLPDSQKMVVNRDVIEAARDLDVVSVIPVERYFLKTGFFERLRAQKGWLEVPKDNRSVFPSLPKDNIFYVGLSIGSGYVNFERSIYMLDHKDLSFSTLVNQYSIVFVNLDYNLTPEDIECIDSTLPYKLIHPGIDLKDDLTGLLGLLDSLDHIVCTPNSIMDMAASLGKATYVIDFTSQMVEWESVDKTYLFSSNVKFIRTPSLDESPKERVVDTLQTQLFGYFRGLSSD